MKTLGRVCKSLATWLRHVREDASGQALVEYALLISLIALVAFGSVQAFGLGLFEMYSRIEGRMP
jgi:Flp pilus assembly pilin Flp